MKMSNDLKLNEIHHVGIVRPSFESAMQFMEIFGHVEDYRGFVKEFECWCIFCKSQTGAPTIEIVVPEGGPLAKFNNGVGGLHHYALLTDDIRAVQLEMSDQGIQMLHSEPVKGAGEFLCNFVSPAFTRGVVVEYVQPLLP